MLAVILKRLDKAYQKIDSWSLKNPLTVHWRFIRFVIYYTLFGILYYNTGLHKSTSEYLSQSRVLNYIPSQYIYTSKETEETRKALDLYLKDGVQDYGKYLRSLKITNNRTEYSSLNNFQQLSILFDFWVQRFYYDVSRDLLPLKSFINLEVRNITSNEVSSHFKFIPLYIDYLFFFLLFLSIFIINTFSYFGIIPFITHKRIKRKLKYLIDRLNAEIQTESNRKFNYKYVGLDFGLFSGKRKRYPIIDERELEFELLGLLENISSIPKFLVRPQFVFVFDELDKIEPHHNTSIADKEEQSTFYRKGDTLLSKEFLRKRQQKISKLLSNLKHFLNTAHAKFIFLAGREMYDAALSETSDRDSFIGSIFHEVLYLNSFLTDPSDFRKRDITSLTEVYICQFLFPDGWKGQKTLKGYNQYLKEFFEEDSIENDKQEQYLLKEKRRKVIVTLQNFITYVTYRSSGAPKKIAHLFEGQIEQGSKTELENNSFNLTVGRNSDNSYLVFNYYDQYICGMITNIQTPFLLSISRNMQDLGDKLLVSTTYLIDHLYKFHRSGFAWRNLEITPEIIDINKAPELRKFINNIIQHLSKVHLQEIVSGLFNFKFHNKIANEISYVSKISESQSAAFNFTLDESLEIKQHYKLKLENLSKQITKNEKTNYIHSIGFILMILGDLYYFDQKYDDAIIHYRDAVQELKEIVYSNEQKDIFNVVLLTRNFLKLGLCYEKKKTYDSAFTIYGKISMILASVRNLEKNEYSQEFFMDNDSKAKYKISEIYTTDRYDSKFYISKQGKTGSSYKDDLEKEDHYTEVMKKLPFSSNRIKIAQKISTFEGIRLIYQPMLAKLYVQEKSSLGGINNSNVDRVRDEFNFITKIIKLEEKFLIKAEFLSKLGDLLYYKNGRSDSDIPQKKQKKIYCHEDESLCSKNKHTEETGYGRSDKKVDDFRSPCSACRKYMDSLHSLCENRIIKESPTSKEQNILIDLTGFLNDGVKIVNIFSRKNYISSLSNTLFKIGDTFLSCATEYEKVGFKFLDMLIDAIEYNHKIDISFIDYLKEKNKMLSKAEESLYYYFLSYAFYIRIGEYYNGASQLLKILYFLDTYSSIHKDGINTVKLVLEKIKKKLLYRYFSDIYRSFDNTHRPEIERFQEIFDNNFKETPMALQNISASGEFREAIILFDRIRIKCYPKEVLYQKNYVNPYTLVNNSFNRINELRLKGRLCEITLKHLGIYDQLKKLRIEKRLLFNPSKNIIVKKFFGKNVDDSDNFSLENLTEFIILDAIFCYITVIRMLKIHGNSYIVSHSQIAYGYKNLADWCTLYENYIYYNREVLKDKKKCVDLENHLKKLVGHAEVISIKATYNYEMAKDHFYKTLDTHRERDAYQDFISDMYYLDDDFNDQSSHFYAAFERYRINTGTIRKQINEINPLIKENTNLYNIDEYLS